MHYTFIRTSTNIKVGPIAVIYADQKTCPSTCPLKDKVCYAKYGNIVLHWRRVKTKFKDLLSRIRDMGSHEILRYGVAGDLPGAGNNINKKQLLQLKESVSRINKAYAYTHKPMLDKQHRAAKNNRELIKGLKGSNFVINLSADSMEEADEYYDLDIAPVVVVLPVNSPKTSYTPKGRKIVSCPQQYNPNITCAKCQLCMKFRSCIVGFVAHGSGKKYIV